MRRVRGEWFERRQGVCWAGRFWLVSNLSPLTPVLKTASIRTDLIQIENGAWRDRPAVVVCEFLWSLSIILPIPRLHRGLASIEILRWSRPHDEPVSSSFL